MSDEHYNQHEETETHNEPDQSTATNQLIDFGSDETNREATPSNGSEHNGYIFVPPTPQSSVDASVDSTRPVTNHEELQKALEDVSGEIKQQLTNAASAVIAEADSSSAPACSKSASTCSSGNKACTLCPYYLLACDKLSKMEMPPRVRDLLLWKCPKTTGAVFSTGLVLLISLACFSFLTVVGSALLVAMSVIGAYRLYLELIFRIKGTYDDTFDKVSKYQIELPKDKFQRVVSQFEADFARVANKFKAILIWDSLSNSAIAFAGFYLVYSVGSWLNTLTLVILVHVSAFTLPKVYQVYKKQIDEALEKGTGFVHQIVKDVSKKLPFLHGKKKTQ